MGPGDLDGAKYSKGRGSYVRVSSIPSEVFEWIAKPGRDEPDLGFLVEAVEGLGEPHRSIVNALFWEQASLTEMAARLGVHRTTLDRLLTEALTALRAVVLREEAVLLPPQGDGGPDRPGG